MRSDGTHLSPGSEQLSCHVTGGVRVQSDLVPSPFRVGYYAINTLNINHAGAVTGRESPSPYASLTRSSPALCLA